MDIKTTRYKILSGLEIESFMIREFKDIYQNHIYINDLKLDLEINEFLRDLLSDEGIRH